MYKERVKPACRSADINDLTSIQFKTRNTQPCHTQNMHPSFILLSLFASLVTSSPIPSNSALGGGSSSAESQFETTTSYLNPNSLDDIIGSGISDPITALAKRNNIQTKSNAFSTLSDLVKRRAADVVENNFLFPTEGGSGVPGNSPSTSTSEGGDGIVGGPEGWQFSKHQN